MSIHLHADVLPQLQASFLTVVLPRLQSHGRVYFRHRPKEQQEEAISEMVALGWKWHLRLAQQGKDAARFPTAIATFAARAVNSGRHLAGHDRSKDVLLPRAQKKNGFKVGPLPEHETLSSNPLVEALHDNTQTPVPEQVHFRLDFPAWRRMHSRRNRKILDRMMAGYRTGELSQRFGLCPARISQLRRQFLYV